jgi:predicted NBD/HSP70 family sugar kinase
MPSGAGPDDARRLNLGAVLRQVHLRGALSRAELTACLGLSRSTVGALTAELSAAGLVSEASAGDRGCTGRPSIMVRPEPGVFVYALHVGTDQVTAARIGLGGAILDRAGAKSAPGTVTPTQLADTVAALGSRLRGAVPPDAVCVGGAAALSGTARRSDGSLALRDGAGTAFGDALAGLLGEVLGLGRPVQVGGGADLGAMAEHTRGGGVDSNDLIYLQGDGGVSGGVIAGGRLLAGRDGRAGEVGHMVVNVDGRPCDCGNRGCWETEIGERALLRVAGGVGTGVGAGAEGVVAVVDAATWGDAAAQAALRQAGEWLALGVANLVNIFNADTVVFGGTLSDVYQATAAQVRGGVNRRVMPAVRERLRLGTPALGAEAPLVGAAELAFQDVLADPLRAGRG